VARWTRLVLRFRWPILAFWLAVILAGGYATSRIGSLLSNTFTVPGTDSERVRTVLQDRFGDRSDGEFLVVYKLHEGAGRAGISLQLARSIRVAARAVPGGRATDLRPAPGILYGSILTRLNLADAKGYTDDIRRQLRAPPGVDAYVTGQPAIEHDLDPVLSHDLAKGESIALPVALFVLLAVFGLSFAATIPFVFAAASITGTLGLAYIAAHWLTMATYVTNLVQLIGLGIAVDYSLLIVYRFREELARGGSKDDAIVRTMATAGRAVIFSGATVAIGLALLLFIPVPFMRSMGVGGFLIPLVSIAAAATLQPSLLSFYGRRGVARAHVAEWLRGKGIPLPHFAGPDVEHGFWARLARTIMRRPTAFLVGGVALLIAAAIPIFSLQLTPGSAQGIPQTPSAVRGLNVLRAAVGPGALSPTQILVDGDGRSVRDPAVQAAIRRLIDRLRRDPEVAYVQTGTSRRFVDAAGRYEQVIVAGHHEYGDEPAQKFVSRLRHTIIPSAGFPEGVRALAGGGPAQGVDFLHRSYATFPWLVLAVLVLTYLLLLRAFRSVVLPLKAVVLNLLSVGAAYGLLVVAFRWGVGSSIAGLYTFPQIEGWIPIFLFAMLFGLSMDYEVFLVTRMRETWDEEHDNVRAVSYGLERTGLIVTAAALIMTAAFLGFVAGSVVGLQQFGFGLAVAIFVDVTIVRALLVPALMALFGRWNWWLPARVARLARVQPSPLSEPRPALRPAAE
jgi:uncharacterized membrane protein YdfJ with MMPL/SSD domain